MLSGGKPIASIIGFCQEPNGMWLDDSVGALSAPGGREQRRPFEHDVSCRLPITFRASQDSLLDGMTDLRRLRLNQHGCSHRAPMQSVENRLWCVTGPDKRQLFERRLCETRSEQGRTALTFVAKAEQRWGKR